MTIRITDDSTRAEIEEAIRHVLDTMRRLPEVEGYRDRGHERINALLEDWLKSDGQGEVQHR
jgi:hypothetical protein